MIERKNNNVVFVIMVLLVLVILGMGFYIAYDKGVFQLGADKEEKEANQKKEDTKKEKEKREDENNSIDEIKELDLTKCLNNHNLTYKNPVGTSGNYGISMQVNADRRCVTISTDWSVFGPFSFASTYANIVETEQISGFSKDVDQVFIGDFGQDATGMTLFYLMSDQSIAYTPVFLLKTDSQNNKYYAMNSLNSTNGANMVPGVNNVVKLYTVDASDGQTGFKTTIAATKDGSFYDLMDLIKLAS